jgi:hypothetical protein
LIGSSLNLNYKCSDKAVPFRTKNVFIPISIAGEVLARNGPNLPLLAGEVPLILDY